MRRRKAGKNKKKKKKTDAEKGEKKEKIVSKMKMDMLTCLAIHACKSEQSKRLLIEDEGLGVILLHKVAISKLAQRTRYNILLRFLIVFKNA